MENSEPFNKPSTKATKSAPNYVDFGISFLALVFVFIATTFLPGFLIKAAAFSLVLFFWAFFYWLFNSREIRSRIYGSKIDPEMNGAGIIFDDQIENRLLALEEANQFFGASLKADDMFRLVSSRVNEIIPFESCAIFLFESDEPKLKIVFSAGKKASFLANVEIGTAQGLAGKAFSSKKCLAENHQFSDQDLFAKEFLADIDSVVAAPLFRDSEIFGVLELFGGKQSSYGESSVKLLEAICERSSPLLLSSLAFEKNLTNALTDPLTDLPNERAFFLVLENQIAESQRNRDERPLTVLAVDIKNFSEINQRFGHSTGDKILSFAAGLIREQLRRMDFLTRSSSDEFLIVLPTASEVTTVEIIDRLGQNFNDTPFEVSGGNRIGVQLNHGSATFWQDGEVPAELLRVARARKRQYKTPGGVKILPFPASR